MTTLSSLNSTSSFAITSLADTAATGASTSSVASEEAAAESASAIVTIPSAGVESLVIYTPDGAMAGAPPITTWAGNNNDAISQVMASDYLADSVSGQFHNLGSALLDRFMTTDSDYSQSVSVGSVGQSIASSTQSPQSDINLTVQTASGVKVDIEIQSGNGTLGVTIHSSGTLTGTERNALAGLADGFQKAIDGLSAQPPTLDLSGLMQYDPSVLSSVNMQFKLAGNTLFGVSGNFSENNSTRSLSLTDWAGTMNLKVDTSQSALWGSGAQRSAGIASYLKQFDNANTQGHGNAAFMALFKDAFTQLNSNVGTASQGATPWLAQPEQAMLTGLGDFTASISDTGDTVGTQANTFSYQVSQSTSIDGDAVSQVQQSHLKASYREVLSSSAYDDVVVDDDASSTVKLAMEKGVLMHASLTQSSTQSTRNSEYVDGKLVSDVTMPSTTSASTDLLRKLQSE